MGDLLIDIRRTDPRLHFEGVSQGNPTFVVPFDFAPPLGVGQGFSGLELLLMALTGCVSTTVVFLLGRAGKHVEAYSATARGIRSERPLTLTEAHLTLSIKSDDILPADLETAIRQAEAAAPVWQAVKHSVSVRVDFELV